jgi:hypothetical protein
MTLIRHPRPHPSSDPASPHRPTQLLAAALYNRTLVTHACRCVFVLRGDEALIEGAWRAVTLLVGISAPLAAGVAGPTPPAGLGGGGSGGRHRSFCCSGGGAAAAEDGRGSISSSGGGGGGQGLCQASPPHGDKCVAAMTYAQIVLGVWAPLVVSYILLLRSRRRYHEQQQELQLQQQERAGAPGAGGSDSVQERRLRLGQGASADVVGDDGPGGKTKGGSDVPGGLAAPEPPRVSPLALVFLTTAVANAAYWGVVWGWGM